MVRYFIILFPIYFAVIRFFIYAIVCWLITTVAYSNGFSLCSSDGCSYDFKPDPEQVLQSAVAQHKEKVRRERINA